MSGRSGWVVLPFVYLLVHYSMASLRTAVEQRRPARVVIPVAPIARVLLLTLFPLYGAIGVYMMWGPQSNSEWWGAPLAWSVAVLTAAFGPRNIYLDDKAVMQRSWLGAPQKILWREVRSVVCNRGGSVTISGSDGTRIRHNFFHVYRKRFLSEIQRRSGFVAES